MKIVIPSSPALPPAVIPVLSTSGLQLDNNLGLDPTNDYN